MHGKQVDWDSGVFYLTTLDETSKTMPTQPYRTNEHRDDGVYHVGPMWLVDYREAEYRRGVASQNHETVTPFDIVTVSY